MLGKYPNIWRLWRRVALLVLAVLVEGMAGHAADAAPAVTGVRIGEHGAVTRLVLELSQSIEYRVFTLAKPYRVVLDMPEVSWTPEPAGALRKRGLVLAFRFGKFTPTTTRVVLDMAAPVRIDRTFVLAPRGPAKTYRLVVDLRGITEAEFARLAKERRMVDRRSPRPRVPLLPKPRRPRDGKRVIVIDAGHGGVDPGTIGVRGTREKHITLAIARQMRRTLEATGRYKVVLTRSQDYYIPLRGRVAKARRAGAEIFISLHADSIRNRRTRGASVYTLSETASDREAAALAAKENRSDVIAGVDLANETDEVANILIDLAQRETMNLSARFANILVRELGRRVRLLRNTHRFAGFAVLKAPDVPSVLLEMGYLSNRTDEALLRKPSYRAGLARALVRALDRYFAETEKLTRS